ncbi:hypothetical protein RYH73_09155 [Olivibacter sp. CPCC 100613]|uniref:hypothetical protein n=1 Tax=Olivibacter sp. CPCC 100613 TaxID=3079931 RepID=UPI002FFCFF9C
MKKFVLFSFAVMMLAACNNQQNNTTGHVEEQTNKEGTAVGGQKDDHGCLVAAGETWSEIKQSCVQIFNVGQRLNPLKIQEGEAVISAFVLFNDDRSKLELFLPNESKTIVLNKDVGETYQNEVYKFDAKESVLYIDNEKEYEAESK